MKNLHQDIDKTKMIYVHCRVGARGIVATSMLNKLGFNAVNIQGGSENMKAAGFEFK